MSSSRNSYIEELARFSNPGQGHGRDLLESEVTLDNVSRTFLWFRRRKPDVLIIWIEVLGPVVPPAS